MESKPVIVFIVSGRGETVSSTLGVFVEQNRAEALAESVKDTWTHVSVNAWVIDYESAPISAVAPVTCKPLTKERYSIGDKVACVDDHRMGCGEVISVHKTGNQDDNSDVVYLIGFDPYDLTYRDTGLTSASYTEEPFYHYEITGAVK